MTPGKRGERSCYNLERMTRSRGFFVHEAMHSPMAWHRTALMDQRDIPGTKVAKSRSLLSELLRLEWINISEADVHKHLKSMHFQRYAITQALVVEKDAMINIDEEEVWIVSAVGHVVSRAIDFLSCARGAGGSVLEALTSICLAATQKFVAINDGSV